MTIKVNSHLNEQSQLKRQQWILILPCHVYIALQGTSFFGFKDTPWNQREEQHFFTESCVSFGGGGGGGEDSVSGEPNNALNGGSGEQEAGKECEGNRNGNVVTEALQWLAEIRQSYVPNASAIQI